MPSTPAETRQNAEFFQAVLDNQQTAVLWVGARQELCYLNPAAETLLRLDARQVLNRPLADCLPAAPEFTAALATASRDYAAFTQRELALPLADGDVVTVDCSATPVAERAPPAPLLVELIPLDRHLRISREDALMAQHAANRLLAQNLAHEVRNPLGGLRGAAQLLERRLADPALKEYTRVIMREADRLTSLVDAMLGPARPLRRLPLNIHELLEHVGSLLKAEMGVDVARDYDPSLPELSLDRDQMVQALLNLARNAVEAAGPSGRVGFRTRVQRQFTLGARLHRLVACVDIMDNGPGVPPELLARIFTPLVTTKSGGTGLGLSIAQELVNRHGGLIECTSRPGDTVFSVLLPLETTL